MVRCGATHAYYVYPLILDPERIGVDRDVLVKAISAEGVPGLIAGYQNIHLLPMYQKKIAFGSHGFPWSSDICRREVDYGKGICPVAERHQDGTFMGILLCACRFDDADVDLVIDAFEKVWEHLPSLRSLANS